MKKELCDAFCNTITVRQVPVGLAVSSRLVSVNDDPLVFFICGPDEDNNYKFRDSGMLITYLEAVGADLDNDTRRSTFDELLKPSGASYDADRMEISSQLVKQSEVADRAVEFFILLSRIVDLEFMAQERAASTFKDDAIALIQEALKDKASIRVREPLSARVPDWYPDLILQAKNRDPVAVFLVQNEQRVLEALLLQSDILKANDSGLVLALLERTNSVRQSTLIKATNRLDGFAIFETDKDGAIGKIASETLGRRAA